MSSAAKSMRRHLWFAAGTILLLGGTSAAWGIWASLDSAVVTTGNVVVESNVKKVQHPTGGIVGQIEVREGQRVKKGDLLLRLDETTSRTTLGIVVNELNAMRARAARLVAERDGTPIVFPADVFAKASTDIEVWQVLAGEVQLFKSRATTRQGQRAQLQERIGQLRDEIKGLSEQRRATDLQLKVAQDELKSLQGLAAKGLVQRPRITSLEREVARNDGVAGELASKISQAQGRISETELQILQLDKETTAEVSKDLRETETKIGELNERRVAAEDQLKRVEIRAPSTGMVHQLAVHTVGGVISQTEPLMLIVPEADKLILEVRIGPQDIDQVSVGQTVRVRFSAFNQQTTPELWGTVFRVAGDLTREPQTGLAYYVAGVRIGEEELKRLRGLILIPGMPAEAYIKTGERSPLSYLIKPLTDQMQRAMRER